jgi:S-formylglutathione hydrolase FrmB
MVPAAMSRDIPVAFQAGGSHAVYLLDTFDAAPDVSNWVTAGNAMNTLAGKGISVVAPAGGAWSMYTNWEQDGSKQWETQHMGRRDGASVKDLQVYGVHKHRGLDDPSRPG